MRKSIVAILAVAIIGTLGIYDKGHNNQASASVQGSSTSSTTPSDTVQTKTAQTTGKTAGSSNSSSSNSQYKDGTYKGQAEETPYGTVQVAAVISAGKITDIRFLQMPGPEGHSKEVTAYSESPLKQSAIRNQSANIEFVSGATTTSEAYMQSLQAALDQAA